MKRESKLSSDILMAIQLIEEFTRDAKDFELYDSDLKTQSAVERQLGIIGEALIQLRKNEQPIDINNGHQIIGFRNRLIHAYDRIDNSIVWAILKRHLSTLKSEIENHKLK